MKTLRIKNSRICIGESYRSLDDYLPEKQVIVITDENVYEHYACFISQYEYIVIPSGEAAKTWKSIEYIVNELLEREADRNTFLIGMGGGVVTDITGFVASVFMRGIGFGFVATSLLAQVDASLGGKNGINFHRYKNILGSFNAPEFVICDAELLKTLPKREIQSGFGEIIKHALIKDADLFAYLAKNAEVLLQLQPANMQHVIFEAVQIKAAVVEEDWEEQGERKKLNFGHTLGHAIENNSQLTHGEAVAAGMYFAAQWSVRKGYLHKDNWEKIGALLQRFSLPTAHSIATQHLTTFVQKDKKKQGTAIDFVFLKQIGEAHLVSVPMQELLDFIKHTNV